MAILITGGSGFLGENLKISLEQEQIEYFAPSSNVMNITDEISIKNYLSGKKIEVVIHLAANSDHKSQECLETNVIGTFNLVNSCKNEQVKHFIFSSTNNVYDYHCKGIFNEIDKLSNMNHYGVSKIMGEYTIRELYHDLTYSILRFSDIYGNGQTQGNLMKNFISNVINDLPINIYGSGVRTRDYLYIDDAVNSIIFALKNKLHGIFNISTGVGTNILELAKTVNLVFNKKEQYNYINIAHEDKTCVILDNNKLTKVGFKPKFTVQAGLEEMRRRM
ncbi:NAD(P)-dependent oxidoreductase [Paenibacillus qinlingensis]|uniref:Nucleoside-diphosphate-sugar epimerase n=1 Tax=Paenibacillus qinlingensis TaxID=1837343 RepID=A0ABU1NXK7_9BACL|nr:NAD(P)-dependent oxidoreductase [Paenibacillus qinlingensis]MDR6552205.1 nucleoside-diphosphate-sugar epimerase [Paenibacillus qinlingensis]